MGCICGKSSEAGSPIGRRPKLESSFSPSKPKCSKPSTTESPWKSSTGHCGPLSAGKPKFGPCGRFLRKTQLQLAARISKPSGHTIANISNGGSVPKFCINQVIPAVLRSDREMAIAEATKGRGLCGKLSKVVLMDSGGLGTSVIVPWLSRENNGCDVGQGFGELEGLEVKAKASDASQLVVTDLKEEFVRNSIFLCSRAVAIYERKYLLGNLMARPVIEKGDILDPVNKPKKDMNMLIVDPEEALETLEYIEVGIEPGLLVSVMVH